MLSLHDLMSKYPSLDNKAFVVYLWLREGAEMSGKNNHTIRILDIAYETRMGDHTVRSAINALIDVKLISAKMTHKKATTYYILELDNPEPPKPRKTRKVQQEKNKEKKNKTVNNDSHTTQTSKSSNNKWTRGIRCGIK